MDHFEFNDIPEKTIHKKPTIKDDPEHINELMDIINGHSNQPIETENEINEVKTTKQEKKSFDSFLHFLYTLAVVALVSFIGLLVFVAFQDFINGPSVIASIIKKSLIFMLISFYLYILLFLMDYIILLVLFLIIII